IRIQEKTAGLQNIQLIPAVGGFRNKKQSRKALSPIQHAQDLPLSAFYRFSQIQIFIPFCHKIYSPPDLRKTGAAAGRQTPAAAPEPFSNTCGFPTDWLSLNPDTLRRLVPESAAHWKTSKDGMLHGTCNSRNP